MAVTAVRSSFSRWRSDRGRARQAKGCGPHLAGWWGLGDRHQHDRQRHQQFPEGHPGDARWCVSPPPRARCARALTLRCWCVGRRAGAAVVGPERLRHARGAAPGGSRASSVQEVGPALCPVEPHAGTPLCHLCVYTPSTLGSFLTYSLVILAWGCSTSWTSFSSRKSTTLFCGSTRTPSWYGCSPMRNPPIDSARVCCGPRTRTVTYMAHAVR